MSDESELIKYIKVTLIFFSRKKWGKCIALGNTADYSAHFLVLSAYNTALHRDSRRRWTAGTRAKKFIEEIKSTIILHMPGMTSPLYIVYLMGYKK